MRRRCSRSSRNAVRIERGIEHDGSFAVGSDRRSIHRNAPWACGARVDGGREVPVECESARIRHVCRDRAVVGNGKEKSTRPSGGAHACSEAIGTTIDAHQEVIMANVRPNHAYVRIDAPPGASEAMMSLDGRYVMLDDAMEALRFFLLTEKKQEAAHEAATCFVPWVDAGVITVLHTNGWIRMSGDENTVVVTLAGWAALREHP
jgi:hypothetical protein